VGPAELKGAEQPGQQPTHQQKVETRQENDKPEKLGEKDKFIQLGHGKKGESGGGKKDGEPEEVQRRRGTREPGEAVGPNRKQ